LALKTDVFRRVETRQVVFRVDVPFLTGIILQAPIPINGTITEICYHFPPGANQLVDVAIRYGTIRISPVTGFITLDAATPVFYVNQPCKTGEDLFITVNNTDIANPHEISCVVTIVGTFRPLKVGEET